MKLTSSCFVLVLSTLGCAGRSPDAAGPTLSPTQASTERPSEAPEPEPRADVLYASPEVVPDAPAECVLGTPLPSPVPCGQVLAELASALAKKDGADRDQALGALESCAEYAPGLIRALRAELGPAECADALVEPIVGESASAAAQTGLAEDVRETLVALGLGARLRRLAQDPPPPPESRTKEALAEYFKSELFPFIERQAGAIFTLASQGRSLSGYARGIVALEAGNADMRFVELARAAPVSDEIARFEEARDVYYATLDEQLEPRKSRGRNAALVGLQEMARAGVRESERVIAARRLLSAAYGGRRVDALDVLLVPPLPPAPKATDTETVAAWVPSIYSPAFVGSTQVSLALTLAYSQQGMPVSVRRAVEASDDARAQLALAHALFESGRTFFRAEDFQAASALLGPLLDEPTPLSADEKQRATLVRALCVALMAGPRDATEVIARGPRFADSLGNLAILDGLALQANEVGARAAFNAAYLRELVAPSGAPDYWKDLAIRYQGASHALRGDEKKLALERAAASRDVERTLREQLATVGAAKN